ncbi:hypothetical protein ACFWJY_34330 [Streptomyces anulatus]|uniref:hypothetical protein n=1 Tax=Streptomyces anulatus TaxID=1892 RepID=UPI0036585A5C
MTATAAARAAVDPRQARVTAGRRAVQVVLFLGGLLALGLLAGGRAEAQERPEPGLLTASVADAAPERATSGAAGRKAVEPSARRMADPIVRPVARPVAEPVIEQVDRAVRQQSTRQQTGHQQAAHQQAAQQQAGQQRSAQPRTVPRAPAQKAPAEAVVESAAELAAEPAAPADALARDAVLVGAGATVDRVAGEVRPLVPSLPVLPPLFSVLPVLPAPGGEPDAPGAPSPSVPDTGRGSGGGAVVPGDAGADASAERAAGRDRGIAGPGSAPALPGASGAPDAGHAQGSEPAPAPGRAPFGPYDDLGRTAVADVQGPRGGDLHAVRTPGGPYTALVRGAGLPATAAPISDRSGEILEFPG